MEGMEEGNLLFGGPEDRRLYYEVKANWVRARLRKSRELRRVLELWLLPCYYV